MAKVLVVEDDSQLAGELVEWLRLQNHLPESTDSGEDALQLLANFKFDLVLLDWNLTGMNGLSVCQRYRAAGGKAPIIFLTGEGDIDHVESGLNAGADDYIVKPFNVRELAARMASIFRRPSELLDSQVRLGGVLVDPQDRTVTFEHKTIHLSPKEGAVLEFLMRHPGRCFSSKNILDGVWPSDAESTEDTVRTCMKTLRQKLLKLGKPDLIQTVPRHGYKIDLDQ
ncbi:MAG: response regulator transcription factor [Cyanobacteria bacterium HKST-UBA02]|nr:response regulator transcription factor [Cyanobacteria bacterium HKST-UBA02]